MQDKLLCLQDEFAKLCDAMYLEQLKEKTSDVCTKLANTEKRLQQCNSEVRFIIIITSLPSRYFNTRNLELK